MHLERVSFGFGERMMPDVLAKRNWNCPESIELNKWPIILKRSKVLNAVVVRALTGQVFQSVMHIRHTAVHRLRTDSDGIERFLEAAELYSKTLGDESYSKAMSQLKSNVELVIADLRQHKLLLQQQEEETRLWIVDQRAELDRLEKQAVTHMLVEDEKYQRIAGDRLKRVILHLEGCIAARGFEAKGNIGQVNDHDQVDDEEEDEFYDCEVY
ncbi:hypothetical protein CMQ_6243 [Grosmannia clavigera kw1407]|uniref:Uncharacterized protein n=1 Tax=Grosmannia clavigera (strain kw1407 / UAMH 11150) TaxID=655863 RepID=F0XLB8_GROCL|nr:uncharacterized protein CMQ_6243 [Grosmannia clavigera kw1407]EFX01301.1 hypothetical protein CMQ_6243 [Grosmannia clavigera kw1407]